MIKVILAHGALGPFDEIMLVVPEIVFVLTLVYSWVRSRKAPRDAPPGSSLDGDRD